MKLPATRRIAHRLAPFIAALCLAVPAAQAAPPGSPWGEKYFPDVELVTQDGRKVKFYADLVKGRRVVVNFIYTSCPRVCGLMTANLARVQRELGDRVGKDIHFYSISLQPETDTPAKLAEYAAAYKAGPGWTFLTGRKEDVALLRKKFGDMAPVEEHAPRVNIGDDPSGSWWSTTALDDAAYLATVIGAWTDPAFDGSDRVAARSYAGVGRIAPLSRGHATFRQKCAACHVPGGQSVGPDLRGVVARRGVPWVQRWIKEPDRVLAEKDPVALELLARHGNVAMPNVGLSDREVLDVLEHLKAIDTAIEREAAAPGAARRAP